MGIQKGNTREEVVSSRLDGNRVTYVQDPGWGKGNVFSCSVASMELAPLVLYISKPGALSDAFLSVKARVSCYTHGTHTQVQAPVTELRQDGSPEMNVFLFHVCFAWLPTISWTQARPLAAASHGLRHWWIYFAKYLQYCYFITTLPVSKGKGQMIHLFSQRCYSLEPMHFKSGEVDSHSENISVLTVKTWICAFFFWLL